MAFSPPLKIGNCHFKLFLCDILAHKPTTHLCTLIILSQQLLVEAGVFVLQISKHSLRAEHRLYQHHATLAGIPIVWTVFGIYDIPTQLWVSRDLDKQGNHTIEETLIYDNRQESASGHWNFFMATNSPEMFFTDNTRS